MIQDKLLGLSNNQNVTADAASENIIDLSVDRDVGPGSPLWIVLTSKAAVGGTSPTLAVKVQTDDNSSFSSATDLLTHTTLTGTTFAAGKQVVIPMPLTNERYLRLYYDVGGTSPDFTIDAYVTPIEPQNWTAFADGL